MIEEIQKHKPKGATHWQAGEYYWKTQKGDWFKWNGGYWTGSFQLPDILCMTSLK